MLPSGVAEAEVSGIFSTPRSAVCSPHCAPWAWPPGKALFLPSPTGHQPAELPATSGSARTAKAGLRADCMSLGSG